MAYHCNPHYRRFSWLFSLVTFMVCVLVMPTAWGSVAASEYNNQGNLYARQGLYEKAIAEYGKAIADQPDYDKPYNNRGGLYTEMGSYDKAMKDLNKAISLNPKYSRALNNRAYLQGKLGLWDKGLEDAAQAIALDSGDATFYDTQGFLYSGKGRYDEAAKSFNKASELDPNLPDPYLHQGQMYEKQALTEQAIADYRSFAALVRPGHPDEVYARARLSELTGTNWNSQLSLRYSPLPAGQGFGNEKQGVWIEARPGSEVNLTVREIDGCCVTGRNLSAVFLGKYKEITRIVITEEIAGQACKGICYGGLSADLVLPAPGRYLIQFWRQKEFGSANFNLVAEREIASE